MNYDLKANENNKKIFKRYFLIDNEKEVFTCVLCGRKTNILNSKSFMGHKLICDGCFYDKFNGRTDKSRKWQEEEEKC